MEKKKMTKRFLIWGPVFTVSMIVLVATTIGFPGIMKNNPLSLAGIIWSLSVLGVTGGMIQLIRLEIKRLRQLKK